MLGAVVAGRLIGRERECSHLEELVLPGAIMTLTGPGGVGKTRLAWSGRRSRHVTGGPSRSPCSATARADADAEGWRGTRLPSMAATVVLAERRRTVVLDDCEHVLGAVREVVVAAACRRRPSRPGLHESPGAGPPR